ncbi:MAG: xanthine dehydrogenase family protein molybdopterin-binding subunit [Chitinophagales bacterium]|nr:xanthine dehydrogenase family protein molybdopterin-binding subunit [Hyphomicrobiales bacterium]
MRPGSHANIPAVSSVTASRRQFLQGAGALGAGLIIGFNIGADGELLAATGDLVANPFVIISPDSTVTVLAKHIEFGQGSYTGLATIVAEELDADWSQVKVEAAPSDATKYNNFEFGPVQGTGGSTAIANSWDQLRTAGATARALLIAAAAKNWNVPASEITVEKGQVVHVNSGKSASFGSLVATAAKLTPPASAPLKDPKDFKLIGTNIPRVDGRAKLDGSAIFTIDVKRDGMLTAVLARSPLFGGTVKSFDATEAKKVKGVVGVVQTPQGVAVLSNTGFWAAKMGRDALAIEWDNSKAEKRGSDDIIAEYKALLSKPGTPVSENRGDIEGAFGPAVEAFLDDKKPASENKGNADAALGASVKVVGGVFEFPYLAHAPMEPLDCIVELSPGKCEIWAGSQIQTVDQITAAAIAGLKPEQVVIHTQLAGGSFGRRATPNADVTAEAVSIAKAYGGKAPIKLIWTREDDIQGGRYRPIFVHEVKAGIDKDGKIIGWKQRIVGQSFLKGTPFEGLIKNGVDTTSVEGANNLPYDIPNFYVDLHTTDVGIPTLWWRAVGSTHTAYSAETVMDELAEAAGVDPVEFRLKFLDKTKHSRQRGVLELVAAKSGWGSPLPEGVARGVAVHESFKSHVAQVAEVRIVDGRVKVDRVVCAVDCGVAVNPDIIAAQMEGGIGFAVGAVLFDAVTLKDGMVEQSNFNDYIPLRIGDMPKVEVHIVKSGEKPTGVGEPGVPPTGPAIANAVYKLTGKRVRSLPFSLTEFGKV